MGGAVYLVCHRYASRPSAHLCTAHYLREDALLAALAERLQTLARQALGPRLPGAAVTDRGKEEPREETQWQDRLAQLEEIRFSAYQDKVAGILTPEELEKLLVTLRREQAQARGRWAGRDWGRARDRRAGRKAGRSTSSGCPYPGSTWSPIVSDFCLKEDNGSFGSPFLHSRLRGFATAHSMRLPFFRCASAPGRPFPQPPLYNPEHF